MILKVNLFSLWQFSCVYILLKDVYYLYVKETKNFKKKNVYDMKSEFVFLNGINFNRLYYLCVKTN